MGSGQWVTVRYRLFDSMGEPLEEVARSVSYLHGGYGGILPKLEAALEGKAVNGTASLYLEPVDAFGDYEADRVVMLPIERLPAQTEPGMTFEGLPGEAPDGNVYTVTDIAQGQAILDGNHPLAGIGVRFDLQVTAIRAATDEEIAQEKRESEG